MQRSDHKNWEKAFRQGLTGTPKAPPAGLFKGPKERIEAGWRIYRNNVAHGLITALGETFPVCKTLVGDEFFTFAARTYCADTVPASPVLFEYGDTFGDFLEAFEPAANVPYLPDIARLEFIRLQSYHANDESPLARDTLEAFTPDKFSSHSFCLHPSVHGLISEHPICEIWYAHQAAGANLEDIDMSKSECAMAMRQHGQVTLISVSKAVVVFLDILKAGFSLEQAAAQAKAAHWNFDLQNALNLLLMHNLIVAIEPARTP